jgi:hypothetical protein
LIFVNGVVNDRPVWLGSRYTYQLAWQATADIDLKDEIDTFYRRERTNTQEWASKKSRIYYF